MKKATMMILAAMFAVMSFAQTDSTSKPALREKKPIKEIKIWKNGQQYDASDLDLICVFDDYASKATVYYELTDSLGVVVANGNIDFIGADYQTYVNRAKHPETALNLTMKALRLQQREAAAARQAARQATSATPTNQ
jgi:hypothetical protein